MRHNIICCHGIAIHDLGTVPESVPITDAIVHRGNDRAAGIIKTIATVMRVIENKGIRSVAMSGIRVQVRAVGTAGLVLIAQEIAGQGSAPGSRIGSAVTSG
jgi:hypothetical protein